MSKTLKKPPSKSSMRVPCGSTKGGFQKGTGAIPKGKPSAGDQKGKKKPEEWALPAMSVTSKKSKPTINWEKVKKDMMRRHAPEGEDIKEIKKICKEVKELSIPVHEFINMVSPYTSDNGACLRTVMAEDLEAFRKLARKVYETMTQDVSDVLVNEQLQMVQYYEEKAAHLTDKMMVAISEIYEMAPEFNFEKYLTSRGEYLKKLLPIPGKVEMDSEALDMQKRMEAYHRLQWLKSEGGRMAEENRRLQRRLEELKQEQQMEQNQAAEMVAEAETKRMNLTAEERHIQERLEELNETVEKQFIASEATVRKEHEQAMKEQGQKITGAIKKTRSSMGVGGRKKKGKRPEWSSTTAADMEDAAFKESVAAEVNKEPSKSSMGRAKKRSKSPHFSPIKTPPPRDAPKPSSPFHYSPPKTPPRSCQGYGAGNETSLMDEAGAFKGSPYYRPPAGYGASSQQRPEAAPRTQETRIDEVSTTVHQKRPQPKFRPGTAPKDTWGGFY